MIPFVAVVSLRNEQSRTFRLWIPLFLIWLLLLPLAIVLSPLIFIACLACRVNPFRGFAVVWQILSALRQAEFDFDHPSAGMSFHIL
ncbi:MAG TPA: hypothetical protein VMX38_21660 [Verrucomicrobiae bacterium]|jgi:uncharacterized membrane protein|nr:hypothetical protein [Verrucomicrobiae bacterium]